MSTSKFGGLLLDTFGEEPIKERGYDKTRTYITFDANGACLLDTNAETGLSADQDVGRGYQCV